MRNRCAANNKEKENYSVTVLYLDNFRFRGMVFDL